MVGKTLLFLMVVSFCVQGRIPEQPKGLLVPPARLLVPPAQTPQQKFEAEALKFGFSGKVEALPFELGRLGAGKEFTYQEISEHDAGLASKLWPRANAEPGKDQDRAPLNKARLKAAINGATPKLTATENYLLATLVRLKAEGISSEQLTSTLAEWRKAEIDALIELRPHATLSEAGLPKEMLKAVKEKWDSIEPKLEIPKFDDMKLSDLKIHPKLREKLDDVLSKLPPADQIKLQASLDQAVESNHSKSIGPNRYHRYILQLAERFKKLNQEVIPPSGHSPQEWSDPGPSSGGRGQNGPPPEATNPHLCSGDPSFKQNVVEAMRAKSLDKRFGLTLTTQNTFRPGRAGTCGVSIIDDNGRFFDASKQDPEAMCPANAVTALHCIAERKSGGYAMPEAETIRASIAELGGPVVVQGVSAPSPFEEGMISAAPLGHDVAVLSLGVPCGKLAQVAKVKLANTRPDQGEPLLISVTPKLQTPAVCAAGTTNCNQGVLVATINNKGMVDTEKTHGVTVQNDCNELIAGKFGYSIKEGTSGSPVCRMVGDECHLTGVVSTRNDHASTRGYGGTIAGVTDGFVHAAVGLPPPGTQVVQGEGFRKGRTHIATP